MASDEGLSPDIQEAWHKSLDVLNGQTLQITVHFADGTQTQKSYVLKTGKMKIQAGNGGGCIVLPQLASDDEPYVYAIFGEEITN